MFVSTPLCPNRSLPRTNISGSALEGTTNGRGTAPAGRECRRASGGGSSGADNGEMSFSGSGKVVERKMGGSISERGVAWTVVGLSADYKNVGIRMIYSEVRIVTNMG